MIKLKQRLKRMFSPHRGTLFVAGAVAIGAFSLLNFGLPSLVRSTYTASVEGAPAEVEKDPNAPPAVRHLKIPEPLKGIYMSQCVAGTKSFRERLVKLIDDTELNAVVIDIKDYTGNISFPSDHPKLKSAALKGCGARDMREFISSLHDKGIFVIGRVAVFQDPHLVAERPDLAVRRASDGAVWKDYKGITWLDAGAKEVWDYNLAIANEAYHQYGFDEINFDYIRFPSDGNMKDISYPWSTGRKKPDIMHDFYKYLHDNLVAPASSVKDRPIISADLFGMVTTNTDDLNIGQILENALPYFDYIAPMVYPSHYPSGFNGWKDVNAHPYDIIKFAMDRAVIRTEATTTKIALPGAEIVATTTPPLYGKASFSKAKLRPWLQDFNYPVPYTPEMVRAQIQATYDAGLTSWLLWDAANKYTPSALLPASR